MTNPEEKQEFPSLVYEGVRCRVKYLFDVDGEIIETPSDDLSEVFGVVAQHPNGMWIFQPVSPEMLITIKPS